MSMWTYVSGTIQVYVSGRTQPEIEYVLKTVLNHLPKVTGSEEDMRVYINRRYGHSMSSHWAGHADGSTVLRGKQLNA